VRATRLEFNAVHCLLQTHGHAVPPPQDPAGVWEGYEPDYDVEGRMRAHISPSGATKLDPIPQNPRFIQTVYGAAVLPGTFLRILIRSRLIPPRSCEPVAKALIQVVVMIERPAVASFQRFSVSLGDWAGTGSVFSLRVYGSIKG